MSNTLLIQSHQAPLSPDWLAPCLHSVRNWAECRSYDYRFLGDEIFNTLSQDIVEKTATQRVVATDLARLNMLSAGLNEGYQTVIWCDADFLIFAPERFELTPTSYGLGREVWIQDDPTNTSPRAYVKVHNAFMFYQRGNAFLDFYRDSAERLLKMHQGHFVPQFIGPKFLTAIHNIVQCPVVESAGMLSPAVIKDLLRGGGSALKLYCQRSKVKIAAANLCNSHVEKGEITNEEITRAIAYLLKNKSL